MESFISLFSNREFQLLAHGIPHETTAVTVFVSRHFQHLKNELAECRGDETSSFSSSLKQCHVIKNADVW
jgi:hypothetical protein